MIKCSTLKKIGEQLCLEKSVVTLLPRSNNTSTFDKWVKQARTTGSFKIVGNLSDEK